MVFHSFCLVSAACHADFGQHYQNGEIHIMFSDTSG